MCVSITSVFMFGFFALVLFFFSSRRRHTRYIGDWSSDVCSSDLRARSPSRELVFPACLMHCSDGWQTGPALTSADRDCRTTSTVCQAISLKFSLITQFDKGGACRSEERRVGKECGLMVCRHTTDE